MSRALDDLDPRFLPVACQLVARASEHLIPVMIIFTRRTAAEQAVAVATGASGVMHSKHQDGLAIDVVPYLLYQAHGPDKVNWDDTDPTWAVLGAIGEALGLRWGGRWQQPHDPGHFEWLSAGEHYKDIPATSAAFAAHGITT